MLDGFVYAVGGWEGSSRLDSVERYNPESNTWHTIPNLRMAVTSPAVVTNEGTFSSKVNKYLSGTYSLNNLRVSTRNYTLLHPC